MNYKISIIVPVYNVEKYLYDCINSILKQTISDFELILVNDGSKDNSGRICDEFSKRDKRIKVIHKENGGLSSARNAGIEVAKGEYIGFIDSDDYIHSNMYEILYKNAQKYLSDIVVCDFLKVNELINEDIIDCDIYCKTKNMTNIESINELYTFNATTFVIAPNKLYKRRLFEDIRYRDGKLHEDEFIIHELLYESKIISYVPIKLYFYRNNNNSITKSKYKVERLDAVEAYIERIQYFHGKNELQLKYKAEKAYSLTLLEHYFRAKSELENIERELRILKNDFNCRINDLCKNPIISFKFKILLVMFRVSPKVYELYKLRR